MELIIIAAFVSIFLGILYTMYRNKIDELLEERRKKKLFWMEWELRQEKIRRQHTQRLKKEFARMKEKHNVKDC